MYIELHISFREKDHIDINRFCDIEGRPRGIAHVDGLFRGTSIDYPDLEFINFKSKSAKDICIILRLLVDTLEGIMKEQEDARQRAKEARQKAIEEARKKLLNKDRNRLPYWIITDDRWVKVDKPESQ